jgi:serine/threonine protein kinase
MMQTTASPLHPTMHSFEVGGCQFKIDKRYSLNRIIGKGAYGVVISCHDHLTGQDVAIKKVTRAFEDLTDSKRILREIMLLKHLKHENTISLLDVIHPHTSVEQYEDVYMVLDLMETDLHRIIHSRQPLTDEHIQFFLTQILKGLKYIHSAGVLHRDLKPSNLLVNASCDLKICDFGLARGVNEDDVVLTEYVVTRWYRAPEVMLSSKSYTYGVDVWSTGCILAELLLRKPLFQGDDYIHQLNLINEFLGSPKEADLQFISSEKAKRFIQCLPRTTGKPFGSLIPSANPQAIDLLEKMLTFNPAKRISVDDALAHPYLQEFANESPALVCDTLFEFKYEQTDLDGLMLRELMWKEMCSFHPDALSEWNHRRAHGKMRIDQQILDCQDSKSRSSSSVSAITEPEKAAGVDDKKKRRRPEDTITPVKAQRHEATFMTGAQVIEEKAASM